MPAPMTSIIPSTPPTPISIFISYAHADEAFKDRLLLTLAVLQRNKSLIAWTDRQIDGGSDWRAAIDQAMDACHLALLLVSDDFLASEFIQSVEMQRLMARRDSHGITVVPIITFPEHDGARDQAWVDIGSKIAAFATAFLARQTPLGSAAAPGAATASKVGIGLFHLPDLPLSSGFNDPANHLHTLRANLLEQGRSAILAKATVRGMGGVGKTQLALKYCHVHRSDYTGVWWLRAEHQSLLEQDCRLFCEEVGITVRQDMPPQQAFRDGLAQRNGWLLVFDNAEDPKMLARFLPAVGKHHVIVTSRRLGWEMPGITLNVWSQEQALPFLFKKMPLASDAARRALVDALGGLPLALEQACAYLHLTQATPEDYLAALGTWKGRQDLLQRQDSADYPLSVLATLALAFDKLSEAARALLALCGWLGPEPIPEFLFCEVDEDGHECLPPVLRTCAQNRLHWRETVAELTDYALCQIEDVVAEGDAGKQRESGRYLVFHRLTQAAIRATTGDEQAVKVLGLLRAAFPSEVKHSRHWPRCRVLMPHAQQVEDYYRGEWAEQRCYVWLLDRLGCYLGYGPALYAQAEYWLRRALAISQGELGEEDPATLEVMSDLAEILREMGAFAGARTLQEKNLEISKRTLGDEHPDTLTAMGNLALTMYHQGDFPDARALQEKTLEIGRRTLGDEHPATLTAMDNLAGTLAKQSDFPGAQELQEKNLAIRRRTLGDEHLDTLTAMANLATTFYQQENFLGARELLETTLEIRKRTLGTEHPVTLTVMGNLALTMLSQGDLPGARAMQETTLEICRRTLGDEHPGTVGAMNNLAMMFHKQGDHLKARTLLASAYSILCRILGEQHPDTLTAKRNLDAIRL